KKLKSRRSAGTRCSRMASLHRLRKNTSSPTKTYAERRFLDCTSETKRSVWANERIRIPPECSTPESARTRGTGAQRRANLLQKNSEGRWRPDTADETDTKGSGRGPFRLCP